MLREVRRISKRLTAKSPSEDVDFPGIGNEPSEPSEPSIRVSRPFSLLAIEPSNVCSARRVTSRKMSCSAWLVMLVRFPQGSPLSPILYVLYNSDLLEIPRRGKQLGLGLIDDILYGVQNKTAMVNASELERLLTKSEQWRQRHGAQIQKIQIHPNTLHENRIDANRSTVTIAGNTIHPSPEAKYLGAIFDQKLKFRTHIEQVAKGIKYVIAIAGIAKSKWGPEFKYLRRLFTAVAAPRICWDYRRLCRAAMPSGYADVTPASAAPTAGLEHGITCAYSGSHMCINSYAVARL